MTGKVSGSGTWDGCQFTNSLPVPCGGCIRRLCPDLCQNIDEGNLVRGTPRVRSSETPLGRSQACAADTRPIVGSEVEQVNANDYMSFPSIPISSPLLVPGDHELVAQLAWGDDPEDYSRTSDSNTTQLRDTRPAGPINSHETRQAQGVKSGPSANVGSLRLDTGGRSRYFGPTAASQWLRDVSPICRT